MKLKKLFCNAILAFFICIPFYSCSNEENLPNDDGTKIELPEKRAYILYEGGMGQNNTGIAFYAPNKDADFIGNIYKLQNSKELGALANSMIKHNEYIYVVVSTSKYISKLNEACVEVGTYKFPEGEGDPRHITADEDFIYVSQWGGKVSKINAKTMERVAEFNGGDNLEGIAECNGKLYVSNSHKQENGNWIYNKEVFVINPETMKLEKSIPVVSNPERIIEENNKIYIHSKGNYGNEKSTLQIIDPQNGNSVTNLNIPINKVVEGNNDLLYIVENESGYDVNGNWEQKPNTFSTYNTKTGVKGGSFLKNAPKEFETANIYLLSIDDETGEIYVGTADYTTTGTIYRFNEDGTFKEKFDAGGINPNTMIFVD